MNYRPEDVVAVIFYFVYTEGKKKIKSDAVSLHPLFFEWRSNNGCGDIFSCFLFDERDYFPYSETLEESINALQFAGHLEETKKFFEIQPSIIDVYAKIESRFRIHDRIILKMCAVNMIMRGLTTQKQDA